MLDALGINLKDLIFAVANFLILVLILGKFLYKPFLGILEKRKQTIEKACKSGGRKQRNHQKCQTEGRRSC